MTGARYSSVKAVAKYGQRSADLLLQDIDPRFEHQRQAINGALSYMPNEIEAVREALGLPVSLESYLEFNDPANFHRADKPWKRRNANLNQQLKSEYDLAMFTLEAVQPN